MRGENWELTEQGLRDKGPELLKECSLRGARAEGEGWTHVLSSAGDPALEVLEIVPLAHGQNDAGNQAHSSMADGPVVEWGGRCSKKLPALHLPRESPAKMHSMWDTKE